MPNEKMSGMNMFFVFVFVFPFLSLIFKQAQGFVHGSLTEKKRARSKQGKISCKHGRTATAQTDVKFTEAAHHQVKIYILTFGL